MKSQESSMFYSFIKINSNCSCEWNRWGCCVERKRKDCGTLTFQDISGMPLRSRFFFSDIPFPRSSLYKLEIKERKLEERKQFSYYSNPWFRYGKSSAFQRPSVFSARTSFSCLWQRIKFSNKSIKLSSFSLFNTGPLRAAQQKEGDPCGRARGSSNSNPTCFTRWGRSLCVTAGSRSASPAVSYLQIVHPSQRAAENFHFFTGTPSE